MGGKRVWRIRSTTAIAILVLLLACSCSAVIYRISSDEIIEDDDSPTTIEPSWQWPARERAPPRSRMNIYPNRVPSWTEPTDELPDGWKMALRRAAFQSLQHEAGLLLGYSGVTPSIQGDVNRELWYRLSVAEFVGSNEYREFDEEELQADITTLAEGLLIHKEGDLQFYITHRHISCACEGARTLAKWSIRRLRHSGPGRGRPQYQLHFSVIPATEEQSIDLVPVRVEPVGHNPSPKYKGIPIFTRNGHKEYNPRFITEYGHVLSAYLRHRDTLSKHKPVQDNRDRSRDQHREHVPTYQSHEPSREEYDEHFGERYSKYQPQQETSEEYRSHYRGRQQNSRNQYHHFYSEQYSSYKPTQEKNEHYRHHNDEQTISFTDFQQPRPEIKVFRPSPQYEHFSEPDPLFEEVEDDDQKAVSQVIVPQRAPIPQVSLIPVQSIQGIPINVYQQEWQHKDHKTVDSSYKTEIVQEHSAEVSHEEWTKRAVSTKSQLGGIERKHDYSTTTLQPPIKAEYYERHLKKDSSRRPETLEDSSGTFPIGSQSLATLVRLSENQHDNSYSKRSTIKNDPIQQNESGLITDSLKTNKSEKHTSRSGIHSSEPDKISH